MLFMYTELASMQDYKDVNPSDPKFLDPLYKNTETWSNTNI